MVKNQTGIILQLAITNLIRILFSQEVGTATSVAATDKERFPSYLSPLKAELTIDKVHSSGMVCSVHPGVSTPAQTRLKADTRTRKK